MTKKHFESIARAIKANIEQSDHDCEKAALSFLAKDMADEFKRFNPNFDRHKFLTACAITH